MNKTKYLLRKSKFSKGAKIEVPQIGKWYKFETISNDIGYGKVVAILENDTVEVEKYFELPSYRPYAAHNWYDYLPWAITENEEEEK